MFSIRLDAKLTAEISREAQRRGVTRTTWATHLVERGLVIEAFDKLLQDAEAPGESSSASLAAIPLEITQRLLFAACFSEAILKKLNASLNRSTSELGIVATQARDQAQAETAALLKTLGE